MGCDCPDDLALLSTRADTHENSCAGNLVVEAKISDPAIESKRLQCHKLGLGHNVTGQQGMLWTYTYPRGLEVLVCIATWGVRKMVYTEAKPKKGWVDSMIVVYMNRYVW